MFPAQQIVVPFTVKNSGVTTVYLTFWTSDLIKNIFTVKDYHENIVKTVKRHVLAPGMEKTHTICKRGLYGFQWLLLL